MRFLLHQDVKLIQLSVGLSFSDTNVATAAGSLTGNSWIKTVCVIVFKACWNRMKSLLGPPIWPKTQPSDGPEVHWLGGETNQHSVVNRTAVLCDPCPLKRGDAKHCVLRATALLLICSTPYMVLKENIGHRVHFAFSPESSCACFCEPMSQEHKGDGLWVSDK